VPASVRRLGPAVSAASATSHASISLSSTSAVGRRGTSPRFDAWPTRRRPTLRVIPPDGHAGPPNRTRAATIAARSARRTWPPGSFRTGARGPEVPAPGVSAVAAGVAADRATGDAGGRVDPEEARAAVRAAVDAAGGGRAPALPAHRTRTPGDRRGKGLRSHCRLGLSRRARPGQEPWRRGRLVRSTARNGTGARFSKARAARVERDGLRWAPALRAEGIIIDFGDSVKVGPNGTIADPAHESGRVP